MYNSHVIPVMGYSLAIWGYSESEEGHNIEYRTTRYYLEVHQKLHIFAIQGDIGWTRSNIRYQLAML